MSGSLFSKVAGFQATPVFSCEYCKICKNAFLEKHMWTGASDCLTQFIMAIFTVIVVTILTPRSARFSLLISKDLQLQKPRQETRYSDSPSLHY